MERGARRVGRWECEQCAFDTDVCSGVLPAAGQPGSPRRHRNAEAERVRPLYPGGATLGSVDRAPEQQRHLLRGSEHLGLALDGNILWTARFVRCLSSLFACSAMLSLLSPVTSAPPSQVWSFRRGARGRVGTWRPGVRIRLPVQSWGPCGNSRRPRHGRLSTVRAGSCPSSAAP